jgi:hypothetical protein
VVESLRFPGSRRRRATCTDQDASNIPPRSSIFRAIGVLVAPVMACRFGCEGSTPFGHTSHSKAVFPHLSCFDVKRKLDFVCPAQRQSCARPCQEFVCGLICAPVVSRKIPRHGTSPPAQITVYFAGGKWTPRALRSSDTRYYRYGLDDLAPSVALEPVEQRGCRSRTTAVDPAFESRACADRPFPWWPLFQGVVPL